MTDTLSGGTVSIPVEPGTAGFGKKLEAGIGVESGGIGALGASLGKKLIAGFAVLEIGKKIGEFISDGFQEYDAADKINAQFQAGLKSTSNVANLTVKGMDKLAESISGYSGQSYASIGATEQVLQTFTNLRNVGPDKIFDQATTAAANMAAKLGGDATASAIQLGKALNDPVKGMTALRRVGVAFTDSQTEQVKAMVKSGNILGAQKVILAELNTEFGGAAKAAGDTLPGAMARLQVAQGELAKKFVSVLAPSLVKGANDLIKLMDKLQNSKQFQQFLSDLGKEFGKLAPSIEKILPSLGEAVVKLLPSLLKLLVALLPALPSLTKAVSALVPVIVPLLQSLVWFVTNFTILPVIAALGKFFDMISSGKGLIASLEGAFSSLPGPLKSLMTGVGQFVGGIVNTIIDAINGLNGAIAAVVNPLASLLHLPPIRINKIQDLNINLGINSLLGTAQQGGGSANSIRALAAGGTVMPTPGGTVVRMAEAGRAETVVDTATLNAAMQQNRGPLVKQYITTSDPMVAANQSANMLRSRLAVAR